MASDTDGSAETELARERTFGGPGVVVDREIRVIDLSDFDARRSEIDEEIWDAACDAGFFQVANHGIPEREIDQAFALTEAFFDLDDDAKARSTRPQGSNAGWEALTQKRPSTGTLDQKESFQLTRSQMDRLQLWPDEALVPSFQSTLLAFERANWALAMRLLGCLARKLRFDDDFFTERHDPSSPEYQSTLRLLHYFPLDPEVARSSLWRAGAHTDYDCLTLLHQRPGQYGLQVCPGADGQEAVASDEPLGWTVIEPTAGTITCNIGDMLMRWSDGVLPSTIHRVAMPDPEAEPGPRYSIAYFAQADRDAVIQDRGGRLAPITAADFLQQRINANFVE